jgi:hypothetical protein
MADNLWALPYPSARGTDNTAWTTWTSPPPFSSYPVAPTLQKKKNNIISKIFDRTSPAQGGFPKPARKEIGNKKLTLISIITTTSHP